MLCLSECAREINREIEDYCDPLGILLVLIDPAVVISFLVFLCGCIEEQQRPLALENKILLSRIGAVKRYESDSSFCTVSPIE